MLTCYLSRKILTGNGKNQIPDPTRLVGQTNMVMLKKALSDCDIAFE